MSTYYQIFGGKINVVASDPSNPIKGQVWFNTATPALKYRGITTGTWASGGNMNTARYALGGLGTQTAALGFGGYIPSYTAATEEYDGTTWTSSGSMANAAFNRGGVGTQTVGLAVGGFLAGYITASEEYNGTAWSAGGALATARGSSGGAGTQTVGLAIGGSPLTAAVEE